MATVAARMSAWVGALADPNVPSAGQLTDVTLVYTALASDAQILVWTGKARAALTASDQATVALAYARAELIQRYHDWKSSGGVVNAVSAAQAAADAAVAGL